jgi:glycosyltransferase involved in cell wall biosynthesis
VLLGQTLEQMTLLRIPTGIEWELLVVNNNSTDDTDEVAERFADRLQLRLLQERTPGKSHALNRAVREASGEYILFTDDDVLVDEEWLAAYTRAFRRWPGAIVFGGPITPWFEGTPPDWLTRTFHLIEYAFGALDLGPEPRLFGGHDVPFGGNMAVRSAEQKQSLYDPSLGPRPGSGIRGEEITLVKRLLAEGAEGWWLPDARIRHFVPAQRQSLRFIREWYRGWGEYLAQLPEQQRTRKFLGRPLWLWRAVVESELRFRYRKMVGQPEEWMVDLKAASVALGNFTAMSVRTATRAGNGRDSLSE